jgi:hypothetical protein
VNVEWLENLVWQDIRSFLANPGEVLERVREQLEGDDQEYELAERRESLQKRLASKHAVRETGPCHSTCENSSPRRKPRCCSPTSRSR